MVDGVEVPMTTEEIAERKAEEAENAKPKPKPLSEDLNEDFKNNPPEVRAQFALHKAAVKALLDEGDIEAAKVLIASVEVPPELKPVKEKMLEKFKRA